MKKAVALVAFLALLPNFAFAQRTLAYYLVGIPEFINATVINLLLAIAFIFFLWNVVRYFIIGGANHTEQEKARRLAVWGILAFVLIASTWGIVNLLTKEISNPTTIICPDYDPGCTRTN